MDNREKNIKLFFELIEERMSRLFNTIGIVETKAGIIIAVLSITLTVFPTGSVNHTSNQNSFNLGKLFLLFSLLSSVPVIFTEKYRDDPDVGKTFKKYIDMDNRKLREGLLQKLISSYQINKSNLEKKVVFLKYSFLFLGIGLILLIMSK